MGRTIKTAQREIPKRPRKLGLQIESAMARHLDALKQLVKRYPGARLVGERVLVKDVATGAKITARCDREETMGRTRPLKGSTDTSPVLPTIELERETLESVAAKLKPRVAQLVVEHFNDAKWTFEINKGRLRGALIVNVKNGTKVHDSVVTAARWALRDLVAKELGIKYGDNFGDARYYGLHNCDVNATTTGETFRYL